MVTLDFPGGKTGVWEAPGYRRFDRAGKPVEAGAAGAQEVGVTLPGFDIDEGHLTNFLYAIRPGEPLRSRVARRPEEHPALPPG